MFFQSIATFFLVFVTVGGTDLVPKILGGESVCSNKSVPYIVSMRTRDNVHFCAGVIIDGGHFVTAASCFDDPQRKKLENLLIYYNSNICHDNGGSFTTVSNIKIHPKFRYTRDAGSDDIAVVTVVNPFFIFDWSAHMTIKIDAPKEGHEVEVIGWGTASSLSLQQKKLTLKIVRPDKNCAINKWFFCAKGVTNGTVCYGDEGGPVVDITQKPPKLVGIVPKISNECIPGKSQRITKIAIYSEFIETESGVANFLKNLSTHVIRKLFKQIVGLF